MIARKTSKYQALRGIRQGYIEKNICLIVSIIEYINMLLYYESMESKQTKNSASKIRANNKYTREHYKRYAVYVPIEEAQAIDSMRGATSANSFILDAIRDKLQAMQR